MIQLTEGVLAPGVFIHIEHRDRPGQMLCGIRSVKGPHDWVTLPPNHPRAVDAFNVTEERLSHVNCESCCERWLAAETEKAIVGGGCPYCDAHLLPLGTFCPSCSKVIR